MICADLFLMVSETRVMVLLHKGSIFSYSYNNVLQNNTNQHFLFDAYAQLIPNDPEYDVFLQNWKSAISVICHDNTIGRYNTTINEGDEALRFN